MGNSFTEAQDYRTGAVVNIAYADTPYQILQNAERVHVDTTDGAISVYLPSVAAMKGKSVSIIVPLGSTNAVTVYDEGKGTARAYDWANQTLNAANDGVLCYSDGYKWWLTAD